ncbi:MAG: hypothetical protein R2873_31850 [Caldilineaceae bacterium]
MTANFLRTLPQNARSLAEESLTWTDQYWDPANALLALDSEDLAGPVHHSVRNSSWYALGLLMRSEDGKDDGDFERAVRTFHAVLDYQFDEPGTPYHGTWYRSPQEDHPPADAIVWRHYDPNWRQFIGTTLMLALEEFGDRLPADLIARMGRAIDLAIEGEPPDRCAPHYTNIALMKAALMTWAGKRYDRPDWFAEGERFGQAAYDVFAAHGTFHEYNSPTYYGVNFYALALWRHYATSDQLAAQGTEMEAALWRDVAAFYHAGLGNVAGPYSRTYGMDMRKYGALLGMSVWLAVGRELAPFPREDGMFAHGHDFTFGPPLALVGTEVPADALQHLRSFQGERTIERRLPTEHDRVATAWIGDSVLLGAESLRLKSDIPGVLPNLDSPQYHPVTVHWALPDGDVGWIRLRNRGPVEARAEEGQITIVCPWLAAAEERYGDHHRTYVFEIALDTSHTFSCHADHWDLPGLVIRVNSNLPSPHTTIDEGIVYITYTLPPDQTEARFELSAVPRNT